MISNVNILKFIGLISLATAAVLGKAIPCKNGGTIEMTNETPKVGEAVTITCAVPLVKDNCPSGDVWLDHNEFSYNGEMEVDGDNCVYSVLFADIDDEKSGEWTCFFPDGNEVSHSLLVRPRINVDGSHIQEIVLTEDSHHQEVLQCGTAKENVVVNWYKDNMVMTEKSGHNTIRLDVGDNAKALEGSYSCSHGYGDMVAMSDVVRIVVHGPPKMNIIPHIFHRKSCSVTARCDIAGDFGKPRAIVQLVGRRVVDETTGEIEQAFEPIVMANGKPVSLKPSQYRDTALYCQIVWRGQVLSENPSSGIRLKVPKDCVED